MKFGIMSLDFKRLPLAQCFELARDYGFHGLEIFGCRSHLYPGDFSTELCKKILSYQEKYQIEVPMYTPNVLNLPLCICSPNERERQDGVKFYKKAVDIASQINAKGVLVVADHPGYTTPRREVWAYLVESMKEICTYAQGKGVQVTIEPLTPMESPIITTVDDCVELIEDVNDDVLYAMMDIVPPVVVQEPFSKYFNMLSDRLSYIHISNTDGKTDAHTRLDEGVLPLIDVIEVFKRHKFSGFVTAELYSENYRDPELILANTARILRDIRKELDL